MYIATKIQAIASMMLIVSSSCVIGCNQQTTTKSKAAAPAKVEMVPHESDLAVITLTPEAESRLGITTVVAESRKVQQHRTFGGEVIIPSGKSIMISAPVAGIVSSSSEMPIPMPGAKVQAGDLVLTLIPLLSPERDVPTPAEQVQMVGARATLMAAQVTAQGDVERGRADVAATKIALDRATKLFADRAGSQRALDDAQAQSNVAAAVLAAAQERLSQLTKLLATLEKSPGHEPALPMAIRAPVEGIVRNVNVSANQQVVGGSSLFEVLDSRSVWVRVPIFVDMLASIQKDAIGRVVSLDGKSLTGASTDAQSEDAQAFPVNAPPTADAATSSADLYFEVVNPQAALRPGQRVGIELPMSVEIDAVLVPAASVLYDTHGGTWLYICKETHRYERRRVSVRWFDGMQAVLDKSPPAGTMVVAEGAAELFGTEFGTGK